jgi:hypothetical protein
LISSFRALRDEIEVKEIHLNGRRYTWTSGTQNPTHTKIDHVFTSKEWELVHPHCHLQAASTSVSHHCPMVLSCAPFQKRFRGFRFESYWLHMPELTDIIEQSWSAPVASSNKARVLHVKLASLARQLKRWNRLRQTEMREYQEAQNLILRLDQEQEQRQLTEGEIALHKEAKNKILGMAAVKKVKLRQRSQLTRIKLGDSKAPARSQSASTGGFLRQTSRLHRPRQHTIN